MPSSEEAATSVTTTTSLNDLNLDKGIRFHQHFTRSQFEKFINLKFQSMNCNDTCRNDKTSMQKAFNNIAQTFFEMFVLYEKQRKDMITIYNLHTKLCEEFGLPIQIEKPSEKDGRRLAHIAEKIRQCFLKNESSSKIPKGSSVHVESENIASKCNMSSSTTHANLSNGSNRGVEHAFIHLRKNNVSSIGEATLGLHRKRRIVNNFVDNNNFELSPSATASISLKLNSPPDNFKSAFFSDIGSSPKIMIRECGKFPKYKYLPSTMLNSTQQNIPAQNMQLTYNVSYSDGNQNHVHRVSPRRPPKHNGFQSVDQICNFAAPTASAIVYPGREIMLHDALNGGVTKRPRVQEVALKTRPERIPPIDEVIQIDD